MLIDDKAPETSCTLGDGSEVIRVVRGVLPPEDDVHRGGRNSGVTSPIGRVSRRELGVCEVVREERFDDVDAIGIGF